MASYLLLRDNKESGPYTLNDIVSLGLKPYDLIWVEGRSAAWRYPSEIAELKPFAPVVEEQPFDRFFKKQESETVEQLLEKRLQIEKEKKTIEEKPAPVQEIKKEEPVKPRPQPVEKKEEENSYQAYQPGPKVFVSKPSTSRNDHYGNSYSGNSSREESQPQKQAASYSSYSAYSAGTEEPVLERKYSQSLDEIKEMYVNTLVQRKTRNRRKELVKKYTKPVLASAFLVIVGIVIGYFILSKKVSLEAAQRMSTVTPSQNEEQSSQQKNPIVQPESNQTATITEADKRVSKLANQQQLLQQKNHPADQPLSEPINGTPATTTAAITQTLTDDPTKSVKQDVEVDPQTNERNRVVRNEDQDGGPDQPKESKPSIVENDTRDLKKLVSVNANDYLRGVFGGIRDLKITVNNRSKFMLDAVTVQVQYVKVSNQPLKTETITFKNINPNDAETIRLPDSQRGMKVTYRIMNIESKQFQRNTASVN